MFLGPVTSGYPGKYVCYAIAAFVLGHLGFVVTKSLRLRGDRRNRESLGVIEKPDAKKNPMAGIALALFDLVILAILISEIYKHSPN